MYYFFGWRWCLNFRQSSPKLRYVAKMATCRQIGDMSPKLRRVAKLATSMQIYAFPAIKGRRSPFLSSVDNRNKRKGRKLYNTPIFFSFCNKPIYLNHFEVRILVVAAFHVMSIFTAISRSFFGLLL